MDTPKISVVKPNVQSISTATASPPEQNVSIQSNLLDNNTSTDDTINQVMLNEVLEDIEMFESQLADVLKLSLNTSKLKVKVN